MKTKPLKQNQKLHPGILVKKNIVKKKTNPGNS